VIKRLGYDEAIPTALMAVSANTLPVFRVVEITTPMARISDSECDAEAYSAAGPSQFPDGRSIWSITKKSIGPLDDTSLKPSCS